VSVLPEFLDLASQQNCAVDQQIAFGGRDLAFSRSRTELRARVLERHIYDEHDSHLPQTMGISKPSMKCQGR
jgi:hypothetical protein